MIYTMGDSHAQWALHDIPGARVASLSGLTMRRVGHPDDDLLTNTVASLGLTATDTLVLSCGEVDIRVHVKPIIDHRRNTSLEQLLREWVVAYLDRALQLPLNGARLVIMGVVPPVPEGKIYYGNVLLPLQGSNAERVAYTRECNRILVAECAARALTFLDVYTSYCDEEGLLRPEVSDGSVHIKDTRRVREQLQEAGIL